MLSRVAEVALGVSLARGLERIASGFLEIASSAIDATAQIQMMEVGLSSLISREMVQLSDGIRTVADVLPEAELRAKGVMDELARIAILSPYQLEAVNYTYRMAMAFGYTSKESNSIGYSPASLSWFRPAFGSKVRVEPNGVQHQRSPRLQQADRRGEDHLGGLHHRLRQVRR
jgi:hypothetical protein